MPSDYLVLPSRLPCWGVWEVMSSRDSYQGVILPLRPQRTLGNLWRHFWLSKPGGRVLHPWGWEQRCLWCGVGRCLDVHLNASYPPSVLLHFTQLICHLPCYSNRHTEWIFSWHYLVVDWSCLLHPCHLPRIKFCWKIQFSTRESFISIHLLLSFDSAAATSTRMEADLHIVFFNKDRVKWKEKMRVEYWWDYHFL